MFLFGHDLGIDLGTANSLIYVRGQGILVQEPSVVALDAQDKALLAVGAEAEKMTGRTPRDMVAVRPLKDGVIADVSAAERMLRHFVRRAVKRRGLWRLRAVIGVPAGSTDVERRAAGDAALAAGAGSVTVMEQPIAAAIGAGLPVEEPLGCMVVDIGAGTTDVAVISLGSIIECHSIPVAGDSMDAAIVEYVSQHHRVLIGERSAEQVKRTIGSALPVHHLQPVTVAGRSLMSGLPVSLELQPGEIRAVLAEPVNRIVEAATHTLERISPELQTDIAETGLVLTGGGALLHGLAERIARETAFPTRVCDDPLRAVAKGMGACLEIPARLKWLNTLVG